MIQFLHEERTPPGGWHYVDPDTNQVFHHSCLWVMRDKVHKHRAANGLYFSETEYREIVARHTPKAENENSSQLGDIVAAFAQPVAAVIDAAARSVGIKSNVKGCSGCKRRRDKLNQLSERMRA